MIVGKQLDSCSAQDYSLAGDEGPLRYWWKKGPPTQMAYTARPRCRRRRHRWRRRYRPCGWAGHVLSLFKKGLSNLTILENIQNPLKIADIISRWSQTGLFRILRWFKVFALKICIEKLSLIIDRKIVGKFKICRHNCFEMAPKWRQIIGMATLPAHATGSRIRSSRFSRRPKAGLWRPASWGIEPSSSFLFSGSWCKQLAKRNLHLNLHLLHILECYVNIGRKFYI